MILEYACKKQKHVCRSTFVAELFAAVDAIDAALHIATAMLELVAGPQTLDAMGSFREGRLTSPLPITDAIDAASVFESIVADFVKVPAEMILFLHLLWVRDLLSRG